MYFSEEQIDALPSSGIEPIVDNLAQLVLATVKCVNFIIWATYELDADN